MPADSAEDVRYRKLAVVRTLVDRIAGDLETLTARRLAPDDQRLADDALLLAFITAEELAQVN